MAIPEGLNFAETFISLGVPHIVAFTFSEFLLYSKLVPLTYNYIYTFCANFYKQLMQTNMTIEKAFEYCLNIMYDDFDFMRSKFNEYQEIAGRYSDYDVIEA